MAPSVEKFRSCEVCNESFKKGEKFKVKRKKAYCLGCYETIRRTKCHECGKPIYGDKLCAMEKDWHPEHFKCALCRRQVEDDTFAIFEDMPVCNECKNSKNLPRSPLVKRCKECDKVLLAIKYFVLKGQYYCEPCYQERAAPKCHTCGDAIIGKWVAANKKNWHIEHFTCQRCGDSLIGRPFNFKRGNLMCVPCFKKYVLHPQMQLRKQQLQQQQQQQQEAGQETNPQLQESTTITDTTNTSSTPLGQIHNEREEQQQSGGPVATSSSN